MADPTVADTIREKREAIIRIAGRSPWHWPVRRLCTSLKAKTRTWRPARISSSSLPTRLAETSHAVRRNLSPGAGIRATFLTVNSVRGCFTSWSSMVWNGRLPIRHLDSILWRFGTRSWARHDVETEDVSRDVPGCRYGSWHHRDIYKQGSPWWARALLVRSVNPNWRGQLGRRFAFLCNLSFCPRFADHLGQGLSQGGWQPCRESRMDRTHRCPVRRRHPAPRSWRGDLGRARHHVRVAPRAPRVSGGDAPADWDSDGPRS